MHLLALGAFWRDRVGRPLPGRQVLMHLLALGAFWHIIETRLYLANRGLNAPFGARCFLAAPPSPSPSRL